MRDFRELNVWEKAHQLALSVYHTTSEFPLSERYGLIDQMRKSCTSIPSNIAEGCGRNSNPEFAHFLQISMGSASELEYQVILAHDLGYLDSAKFNHLSGDIVEVKKMLPNLLGKLRAKC